MSYEVLWDDKARDFLRKIHQEDAKRGGVPSFDTMNNFIRQIYKF